MTSAIRLEEVNRAGEDLAAHLQGWGDCMSEIDVYMCVMQVPHMLPRRLHEPRDEPGRLGPGVLAWCRFF